MATAPRITKPILVDISHGCRYTTGCPYFLVYTIQRLLMHNSIRCSSEAMSPTQAQR
ncbi:hypothetical protein OESDEN_19140 [Oesophagostomum dentatum]|uniref:Uncharacterized protein n=1 Tax=Oesophagostomum dentatum TaxID=61180 RepID=A0A0B1S8D6_OESDE|nr:hypothetical protein OESDEN_19140 [Oesophagostomum dentatum]